MAEIDTSSAHPAGEPPETGSAPTSGGRFSFLAIPLLALGVALAVYMGINVLSVLFAVVSPPLPPTPPDVVQTSHESTAYGVDYWRFTSTRDGCTLVRYLEENGGVCQIAPAQCTALEDGQGVAALDGIVARCSGKQDFSVFTMQWAARIIRERQGVTQLQLDREVYWLGTGPQ